MSLINLSGKFKFKTMIWTHWQPPYRRSCWASTFERQSHLYQGRMSGPALFLLACIHPVTSCRAGWSYVIHGRLEFHPSMSSGSSMIAAPCIQARLTHAHLFYLGIEDFVWKACLVYLIRCLWLKVIEPTRAHYFRVVTLFWKFSNSWLWHKSFCFNFGSQSSCYIFLKVCQPRDSLSLFSSFRYSCWSFIFANDWIRSTEIRCRKRPLC